jgi:hypothetical protein
VQVRLEGGLHKVRTESSENLLACLTPGQQANVAPLGEAGFLSRASLLVEFADSPTRREIEICPPHNIGLQRPSDLGAISRWLYKTAFNGLDPRDLRCYLNPPQRAAGGGPIS